MAEPETVTRALVTYQSRKRPAESDDSTMDQEWECVQRRKLEHNEGRLGQKKVERVKLGPFRQRHLKALNRRQQRNNQ